MLLAKSFDGVLYVRASDIEALQAENAALKEQVAQQKAYYESVFEDGGKQIAKHKETIAQQAEALRVKNHALDVWLAATVNQRTEFASQRAITRQAVNIQPNPDILRERDARLVERIAHGNIELDEVNLQWIADKIRKGEFK